MSTAGDVSRQCDELVGCALGYAVAERRVNKPGGTPAFNAAQGDVIREACKLAALVQSLEPGAMPPAWRDRQVAS